MSTDNRALTVGMERLEARIALLEYTLGFTTQPSEKVAAIVDLIYQLQKEGVGPPHLPQPPINLPWDSPRKG